jgi:hypothetical protein
MPDYEAKLSRFKDVDSETLASLYKDVEQSHKCILEALETSTGASTFYFSADARNCSNTLAEIKTILFSRGVRDISECSDE